MSFVSFLVSKMTALFSSEYRDLQERVSSLDSCKKRTLLSNEKLQKDLILDLERRLIMKESVNVLTEIYNNLRYVAAVVSLSEFFGVVQDLNFTKQQLEELEVQIKAQLEQADEYSKELIEQNKGLKIASNALKKFGVLIKFNE